MCEVIFVHNTGLGEGKGHNELYGKLRIDQKTRNINFVKYYVLLWHHTNCEWNWMEYKDVLWGNWKEIENVHIGYIFYPP